MLGVTFPASSAGDAFVIAMDPHTRDVLWSYPGTSPAGYDQTGFNSVVEVAVLGTRDCGAVYVLGCTVPSSGTQADCVVPAAGKRGFLAKLDLMSGREIWVENFVLGNPDFDFFLPTAMTAKLDKLWIAGTVSGKAAIAGTQVVGAAPQEAVVLQLSR